MVGGAKGTSITSDGVALHVTQSKYVEVDRHLTNDEFNAWNENDIDDVAREERNGKVFDQEREMGRKVLDLKDVTQNDSRITGDICGLDLGVRSMAYCVSTFSHTLIYSHSHMRTHTHTYTDTQHFTVAMQITRILSHFHPQICDGRRTSVVSHQYVYVVSLYYLDASHSIHTQDDVYRNGGAVAFENWQTRRLRAMHSVRMAQEELGRVSVGKATTFRMFRDACIVQVRNVGKLLPLWNSQSFASVRFRYRNRLRSYIDKAAQKLVSVVENNVRSTTISKRRRFCIGVRTHTNPVVFAVGKYSPNSKTFKGRHGGAPLRRFVASLSRLRLCVSIDEFYTTKRCFLCKCTKVYMPWRQQLKSHREFSSQCYSENPRGSVVVKCGNGASSPVFHKKRVHGSMQCSICGVRYLFSFALLSCQNHSYNPYCIQITSPRDWQGSANILYILVCRVLYGTKRPMYLCRPLAVGTYTLRRRRARRGQRARPPVPFATSQM